MDEESKNEKADVCSIKHLIYEHKISTVIRALNLDSNPRT